MRRSLILPLVVVALGGVAVMSVVRLGDSPAHRGHPGRHIPSGLGSPTITPTSPSAASPTPIPIASSSPSGSATLTYLRGTRIVTRAIGTGGEHAVVDLHTADVTASPTSSWVAYVIAQKGSDPSGNGDFVRRPELHLLDLASGRDVDVGLGFGPLWKTDGTEVAYLAPERSRSCDGESCAGAVRVMLASPAAPARTITGFGRLHLLAWAGTRVLVSNDADPTHTISVATDGSRALTMAIPPREIWDASPDGGLLITVSLTTVSFTELRDGRPTRTVTKFDMPAALGDGSWSTRPSRVAGVVRKSDGSSLLALLSAQRGVVSIPGSQGAMGNVVWEKAAGRFAFVAVDARHPNRLQAVLCRLTGGATASCRRWFSWSQGVSLLELSGS